MARFFDRSVRNTDVGLLVLRLAVSSLMLVHGYGKLMKVFSGDWEFPDPLGIGAGTSLILTTTAEFLCMILLIVGFKTRLAVLLPLATMLVAALVVHSGDPWGDREPAVLYAAIFFVLLITGAGRISLDGAHHERRRRPPLR